MIAPERITGLDAQDAIGFLIVASGNPQLAALRATQALGHPVSDAQLLATIAADPAALSSLGHQVTLLALIRALEALALTHTVYIQKVDKLLPKDVARAYTDLLNSMSRAAIGPPPTPPDPFASIMKHLDPEVAEAVEILLSKSTPSADVQPDGDLSNVGEYVSTGSAHPPVTNGPDGARAPLLLEASTLA